MKHEIKKQKTAADNTGDKSSITPREIEKKRTFAQRLTITGLRNFLRLELEITGEEMDSEKRVFKKNNLIRPANKKTQTLFCQ